MQYEYTIMYKKLDSENGKIHKDFRVNVHVDSDAISADYIQDGIVAIHENVQRAIQDNV